MVSLQALKNWLANPKVRTVLDKISLALQAIKRMTGSGLPVLIALLFSTSASRAAFVSQGSLATANSKTSASSWTLTTSAQLDQNNAAVLVIAVDNIDGTDLNSSLCSSVSDDAGNDWVKAREFTNGQGSSNSGATVCIFYTKAIANLVSGASVNITFSTAKSAKAATMWEFSMNATNIITVAGGADLANDASDADVMTISGLPSHEYLFVRGGAVESNGTTYSASTNYSSFTHTSSTTSGGGSSSNMAARGEFRILTGTGDTTDPITSASDQASVYVAIAESAPPAGGGPRRVFVSQLHSAPLHHE